MSAEYFLKSPSINKIVSGIPEKLWGPPEEYEQGVLKKYKEFERMGLERARKEYPGYFKYPELEVVDQTSTCGSAMGGFTFSLKGRGNYAFNFTIARYPHCCGALVMYGFNIHEKLTNEDLDALFQAILQVGEADVWGMYAKNRRIIVMMVQRGGHTVDNDGVWHPGEAPVMSFPNLWEYFHTKKVNTRYMYNTNSHNLLHDMEVIL